MKKKIRKSLEITGVVLSIISIIFVISLISNLLISLGVILVLFLLGFIIWRRLDFNLKRKLSENVFIVISGISAFVLVGFVLYLLIHIFWGAKSHLTLEFIFSAPEEGLTEGGIFPAIFGTALLVIIMSIFSVPLGTVTAIYLTEYARENSKIARAIRFAINTLAGVPAIVFGLFGLGFFIGTIGQGIDKLELNNKIEKIEVILDSPKYSGKRISASELISYLSRDKSYWTEQIEALEMKAEEGNTRYSKAQLTSYLKESYRPKWGQPALIWAALTMALLTLPVVIVSVEEAIKTVPRELREASLALGATKFGTIMKIVLPGSITGILTGAILAVSRGAGEVAPILFTGAAYYLPHLPNALNSQFMELGYHIYILTTQSTNVDQTMPLQFATTFILLFLTFALNFSAIFLRSKIRKKLSKLS